jgi:hypothetical protein
MFPFPPHLPLLLAQERISDDLRKADHRRLVVAAQTKTGLRAPAARGVLADTRRTSDAEIPAKPAGKNRSHPEKTSPSCSWQPALDELAERAGSRYTECASVRSGAWHAPLVIPLRPPAPDTTSRRPTNSARNERKPTMTSEVQQHAVGADANGPPTADSRMQLIAQDGPGPRTGSPEVDPAMRRKSGLPQPWPRPRTTGASTTERCAMPPAPVG